MKKLLSIMFVCAVMTATGTNEKEIVANNFENFEVEKNELSNEIKFDENNSEIGFNDVIKISLIYGCGSTGNAMYDDLRFNGMSHRDARRERRAFVRECRGGRWWEICIGSLCI